MIRQTLPEEPDEDRRQTGQGFRLLSVVPPTVAVVHTMFTVLSNVIRLVHLVIFSVKFSLKNNLLVIAHFKALGTF